MRLNQFLAKYTGLSRRGADKAVAEGRVEVNGVLARIGDIVVPTDVVTLDGQRINTAANTITIIFHKPTGYVCSRNGQGSKTIYDVLPKEYRHLNPVGRLDKESSGLLLLTNDGELANQLTHPRYGKIKKYQISLNRPLEPLHQQFINNQGIILEDGISRLSLERMDDSRKNWQVIMSEGRNRQIRRTFAALGYKVQKLHRTDFGPYTLGDLLSGSTKEIETYP